MVIFGVIAFFRCLKSLEEEEDSWEEVDPLEEGMIW